MKCARAWEKAVMQVRMSEIAHLILYTPKSHTRTPKCQINRMLPTSCILRACWPCIGKEIIHNKISDTKFLFFE